MSETRGRANRLANADHANLVRTSHSLRAGSSPRSNASVQLTSLEALPCRLREAADLGSGIRPVPARARRASESTCDEASRSPPAHPRGSRKSGG